MGWEDDDLGPEMTESEMAAQFKAKPEPKLPAKPLPKTPEEVKQWEKEQNESTDIYRIKARVANNARQGGASLTPQGEMLCNTYVHVLKSLYDFADTTQEPTKTQLKDLIRSHEGMPGTLIRAAGVGVREKKRR